MDMFTLLLAQVLVGVCLCGALLAGGARVRLTLAALQADPWSLALLARLLQLGGWTLLCARALWPAAALAMPGELLLGAGVALDVGALWQGLHGDLRKRVLTAAAGLAVIAGTALAAGAGARTAQLAVPALFYAAAGVRLLLAQPVWPVRRALGAALALLGTLTLLACVRGADAQDAAAALAGMLVLGLSSGLGHLLLAREVQQQEVIRLAVIDPLTDAPNRRGFFNALAPWMALARRPGQATAIVFLDLDHFKRVNDTYGHAVGDVVLKSVVDIVKNQLRDSDLVGRFGGAELAILLPRTSLDEAQVVAERIRKAIDAMPIKTDRAVLALTASLGLTTIAAHDSVVTLFKRVDQALAAAKQAGRNQVSVCVAPAPDAA